MEQTIQGKQEVPLDAKTANILMEVCHGQIMDNFRKGLHSFFVTGPKMYQLYKTSFTA
jgi:hypothetical protein